MIRKKNNVAYGNEKREEEEEEKKMNGWIEDVLRSTRWSTTNRRDLSSIILIPHASTYIQKEKEDNQLSIVILSERDDRKSYIQRII